MARTEMMLRLLKIDPKSPSGYRIVGYQWTLSFGEARKMNPEYQVLAYPSWDVLMTLHSEDGINWKRKGNLGFADAFELGAKVGDEWWFSGDSVEKKIHTSVPIPAQPYEIYYGEIKHDGYGFFIEWDSGEEVSLYEAINLFGDDLKHIGNIHEVE